MSLATVDLGAGNNAVNSGSLATMNALTGVPGQLFYNTTYNAYFSWVSNRWWPFGNPDPRYGFEVYDEFLSASGGSQLGWTASSSAGIGLSVGSSSSIQGVYYLEPTTSSTSAYLSTYVSGAQLGVGDLYVEGMIQFPVLATVSQDFCASFGFNNNNSYDANGGCTNGAYITLNRALNGTSWITNTVSGGTTSSTGTASSVVAATWYRLGVYASANNSNVVFSINGTTIATHTTNIPTGPNNPTGFKFKMDKTNGNAAVDMYVDYFAAYGFFNGKRVP